ncbi:hypothetical protein CEXT_576631 [Caerostris extrusa]|uniref:Uncharacterized protein n=1 Tax=Caerostris extrusa TaxID=172846 RepID=A0AAV4Y7F8_CAEEX|nr:hypothetical protein CEXT_576631 [Caerostris extrusa]
MASEDVLISLAHSKSDHLLREVLNFAPSSIFDFKNFPQIVLRRCVLCVSGSRSNGLCPPVYGLKIRWTSV